MRAEASLDELGGALGREGSDKVELAPRKLDHGLLAIGAENEFADISQETYILTS